MRDRPETLAPCPWRGVGARGGGGGGRAIPAIVSRHWTGAAPDVTQQPISPCRKLKLSQHFYFYVYFYLVVSFKYVTPRRGLGKCQLVKGKKKACHMVTRG